MDTMFPHVTVSVAKCKTGNLIDDISLSNSGLILGLRPANERRRYKVTPSLIGWAPT